IECFFGIVFNYHQSLRDDVVQPPGHRRCGVMEDCWVSSKFFMVPQLYAPALRQQDSLQKKAVLRLRTIKKIRNVSQLSRGSSFHERFSNLYPHQHMVSWVNATDTQTMSLSFLPHSPAWASTCPY